MRFRLLFILLILIVSLPPTLFADEAAKAQEIKLTIQFVGMKAVAKSGKEIPNTSQIENFATSHTSDTPTPMVFYVNRKSDGLSPYLMEAVLKKKTLKKVIINLAANGTSTTYQLHDVLLVSFSTSGYNAPESMLEQLAFQAANVKVSYDSKEVKSEVELKL